MVLRMVGGTLEDHGPWGVSLVPLQELLRRTQGVEELLEPLGDHVPVGVGHVAPVLGQLQQRGEEALGGGVLMGAGLVWVPCEKMPHGGSAS